MFNLKHKLQVLKKHIYPFKFILSRFLLYLGIGKFITFNVDEYKLRLFATVRTASLWIDNNQIRKDEVDFLKSYLKKGDVYIDVGANIGELTLTAAKLVGKNGKLIAIEPHPTICKYLIENIRLNNVNNVEVYCVAVGEQEGEIYFTNSSYSLDPENRVLNNPSSNCIKIPMVCLQDIIKEKEISLLKIDTEGYEYFCLKGAKQILDRVLCLYVEVSQVHLERYNCNLEDMLTYMTTSGFQLYKFSDKGIYPLKDMVLENTENIIGARNISDLYRRIGVCKKE